MGNSKVILGNETLIDLTGDTVEANKLLAGETAHNRSGNQVTGTVYGVPSGGTTGQYLTKHSNADGDTEWTTLYAMTGASAGSAGAKGLVPAPAAGDQDKVLYGDGTWKTPTGGSDMTGATASTPGTHGLVPAPAAGDNTKFLRGDGTWAEAGGGGGGGFVLADWLTAGGLNPMSYADLAAVLADEKAVHKLMTIHLAVDYLAGQTAVDASINTILTDNTCAKWINLRDYALDTLYDNALFATIMDASGKYFLGEWALMPQVPKMTSNTAPYGKTVCTVTQQSGFEMYKAFDDNGTTQFLPTSGTASEHGYTLGYKFVQKVIIKGCFLHFNDSWDRLVNTSVVGSNDGTNWTTLKRGFSAVQDQFVKFDNTTEYLYYGITLETTSRLGIGTLQFYSWAPKGNVPIMTSNTAPYGTASAYQVFDGNASTTASGTDFSYQFVNPICPKDFICKNASGQDITGGTMQASNDGSTWAAPVDGEYYLNLRVHFAASTTVATVQFYGREMKVSVPVMTSNTAPYGEAIKDFKTYTVVQDAWNAFSGRIYARCSGGSNYAGVYVGYGFTHKAKIKLFKWRYSTDISGQTAKLKFIASNDKTNWVDASEEINFTQNMADADCYTVSTIDDAYKYWALYVVSSTGSGTNATFRFMNFFGFDYSEYDWDADNPRHYLYDHGVELETLERLTSANGWMAWSGATDTSDSEKLPDALHIISNTAKIDGYGTSNPINLSAYDLFRFKCDANGSTNNNQTAVDFLVSSSKTNFGTSPAMISQNWFWGSPEGYIDISSVSQDAYLSTMTANLATRTGYVYEMWLE